MRNITNLHERKLRNRTRRRAKAHAEYVAEHPIYSRPKNALYEEGLQRVAAIGINPKYLSSHARKRCGYNEDDFEARRIVYNQQLQKDQVAAAKAKMGNKPNIEVRSR